ncbi:hypothetical protein HYY70_06790 [Candidatus Woesearchaeota archaeon]|nr:hypothetical protein [Candidatus Woesearchaeota archaeon]
MDSKEDEEISVDFSKIKNFFRKKENKEEHKHEEISAEKPIKDGKKDEEEIVIDLSKIKNLFKSDKKDEKTEYATHKEEKIDDEAELSFDFSKVKKIFKTGEKHAEGSGDEISVNWGNAIDFFKKYGVVFIALIPIFISIYVRMQAGFLPVTDSWATNSVINGVRSQIMSSISQQYPNLPEANRNALVDTELQKVISQNKKQIDDQIRATSAYFKSFFQDENGKNYMPDIDPYYWVRYAKNILEHGHPGDVLRDGVPYDTHQLAPVGRQVFPDMFHPYSLAYFYKIIHIFTPDLSLMRTSFYLPVLVSALCVLLVFLIGRKIAGDFGGFFAGTMMAVNVAFLGRTLFGHADNDIWVIFFPLLVTWLFIATIGANSLIKVGVMAVFAGFFTGMFTFAWSGWWYIFDFLLGTIFLTLAYLVLTSLNDIKKGIRHFFSIITIRNLLVFGVIYFASTAAFVAFFSGGKTFQGSLSGPLSFPSIKAPVAPNLWPNVLTTVAELNEGSINAIINSVGGKFLFFISLAGLILSVSREGSLRRFDFLYIIGSILWYALYFLLVKWNVDFSVFGLIIWILIPIFIWIFISVYKKDSSYDFKLSILLALWIVSTIFASIKGIRFTLLLAPAFSVALGVALGKSYSYLSRGLTKELKIHKAVGSGILIVLLLLIYVNPIRGAISAAGSDLPIINDAWFNALNAIKQDSKEDAIITSWWDFGHHFKAIAERRVTFDGTTQTFQPAHWVGKLLMMRNETYAIGILRMLDCGLSIGFTEIDKAENDTHKSLKIVNQIISADKKSAEKMLKELKFSDKGIEKILSLTHCNPPQAYFIASEDMIGKSGVWSHFGSWNFERADLWFNARKMPQEKAVEYMMARFNYTAERAENIYFEMQSIATDSEANTWVSPWPGYGGVVGCSKSSPGIYLCGNGFQVNMTNYDVFAMGQQGIVRPKVAAFTTYDGLSFKEFNGTTLDFGITIIPKNENELDAVLSSKELAGGMFTRMFFMQGHGLRYFKLFDHQRGLTGTNIYTYKVDWEGKNVTIVDEYVKNLKKIAGEEISGGNDNMEPEKRVEPANATSNNLSDNS